MQLTVDRCLLRGQATDLESARRALTAEAENWNWPALNEGEVVILRRLEVRETSRRLHDAVTDAAERLLLEKVDGWSASAAHADCIWFRSEADLLARLSLDLALGRARSLWFWQSYRQYLDDPNGPGLARLWQSHAGGLPALVLSLRQRGCLDLVWNALDQTGAREVLAVLPMVEVQWSAPRKSVSAEQLMHDPNDGELGALHALLAEFRLPPLSAHAAPPHTHRLAAVLTLSALRPHWAVSTAQERLESRLHTLLMPLVQEGPVDAAAYDFVSPEPTLFDSSHLLLADDPSSEERTQTKPDVGPLEPSERSSRPSLRTDAKPQRDSALSEHVSPLASAVEQEPGADDSTEPFSPPPQWQVQQGGLFFLLNLLNWRPVRERLLQDSAAMAFPSGWGWLIRVGEEFGFQPEAAITGLLAQLSGMEPVAFSSALPPLAMAPEIAGLGRERFGPAMGLEQDCSKQEFAEILLQRSALITYVRPELDLVFAMSDLDIRIRRAGLDQDPEWIDWLGARVRFHYRGGVA